MPTPKPSAATSSAAGIPTCSAITPHKTLPAAIPPCTTKRYTASARARTHSVDWRSPEGTWTRGPAHRWKPVPVTEADRALVMERLKARGLPQGIEVVFPFAETKPSFEQAMGRPNGEVWLQYSPAGEQEPIRYAVFGRDGKFMHDTTLPQGVRLVGFGTGNFAYGVGINPDGTREVVRLK